MKQGRKRAFLASLRESGGIICAACKAANITRQTYYNWYKSDPDFKEQADEVQAAQIDFVESKLLELINAGDTTATIFYLKTKGKSRGYAQTLKAEVNFNDLSDEQLNNLIAEITL